MGIIILLLSLICGLTIYFQWTARLYRRELLKLNAKDHKMKRILGMGLFIVDRLPIEKIFKKPNYSILQLYGRQDYSSRVRLYEGEKIALFILIIMGTLFVACVLVLKNCSFHRVEVLEKAPYGQGNQTYHYAYEIEMKNRITEEAVTIVVPQQKPNMAQQKKTLDLLLEELPGIILNGNNGLEAVNEDLNLIKDYDDGNITLSWESENELLLRDSGEIRYNNLREEGETVKLKSTIHCYGLVKEVNYEVTLFHRPLSQDEERALVINQIKSQLSVEKLRSLVGNEIVLPKTEVNSGAKLKWYNKEKTTSVTKIMIGGLLLAGLFYRLKIYELKSQVRKKEEALLRDFPGCINKFALLMNAGLTFNRAWEKITTDYVRLKQMQGKTLDLYEEMLITLEDIGKGMSEMKAYEAFGQRCKIPEILRFTAMIMQNIKKGSHLLIGALQQQSKEALTIRQDLARKKGEKASTKLIFPMGIMFIAILIIVMTPAIITLKL